MRSIAWIAVLTFVASCRGSDGAAAMRGDSLQLAGTIVPRDSADSVLLAPRVVRDRTVLVFWLAAADTFSVDDQAAVLDELTLYTDRIAPVLTRHGIALIPTNADTVYLALPNGGRRPIMLSGLEFPFGYVFVNPDEGERILSGIFPDDELLEELRIYFDLPDIDTTAQGPRITT
jgi:hypothetical protein